MFKRLATIAAVLLCSAAIAFLARPAAATQWDAGARAADEAYWAAYNRGDADAMNAWLSLDVEFYHDRGGKLIGKKALAAANDGMKTNRTRLRREAIPGTMRFYPMREGETVYGAMAVGEHRFYAKEDGKPEELVGRANYTHLMRLEGNQWRIARIFSFEHIDAP